MMYICRLVYKFFTDIILSWLVLDGDTKGIFLNKCLSGHLVLYPHDKCERFLSRQCQAEIVI